MTEKDISETFKTASIKLYRSLECVGISKEFADFTKHVNSSHGYNAKQHRKIFDFMDDFQFMISGSASEGLPNLNEILGTVGDIDYVIIPQHCLALETDSSVSLHRDIHQLLIHHNTLRPGYVTLELKNEGSPMYFPRVYGMFSQIYIPVHNAAYLSSSLMTDIMQKLKLQFNSHKSAQDIQQHLPTNVHFIGSHVVGPSVASDISSDGIFQCIDKIDIVVAIKCPQWPSAASEWISRERKYDWPPQIFIVESIKHGAEVVPVGCMASPEEERNLEWRLSFSETERDLMSLFNDTQFKCYACVKILMKRFISPSTEVLTSYTVKTAMFWLIEETPCTLWVPDNLVKCILRCLNRILQWIIDGYCPHFFVRDRNMFLGQYNQAQQPALIENMLTLMCNLWSKVSAIPPFDSVLTLSSDDQNQMADEIKSCFSIENDLIMSTFNLIVQNFMDSVAQNRNLGDVIEKFETQLRYIRSLIYAKETFKFNMSLYYQILFKHQMLAIQEKLWNNPENKRCSNVIQAVNQVVRLSRNHGGVTGRVLTAQMFVLLEKFREASDILKDILCEKTLQTYVRSNEHNFRDVLFESLKEAVVQEEGTDCEPTACVVDIRFLQVELPWLPNPIKLELCANLPDNTMTSFLDLERIRQFTVTVDPLVYGCYLKFHCEKSLDYNIAQLQDIRRFERCCAIQSIPYKDVAYNLLGDCYLNVGEDEKAYRKYMKALRVNRRNQATLWRIAKLVHNRLWSEWSSVT